MKRLNGRNANRMYSMGALKIKKNKICYKKWNFAYKISNQIKFLHNTEKHSVYLYSSNNINSKADDKSNEICCVSVFVCVCVCVCIRESLIIVIVNFIL